MWLLVTMHHIVSDGWSIGVLLREVAALYRPMCGAKIATAELAIQYADFAHWQRGWLQGEVLDAATDYWRQSWLMPDVIDCRSINLAHRCRTIAARIIRSSFSGIVGKLRELSRRWLTSS